MARFCNGFRGEERREQRISRSRATGLGNHHVWLPCQRFTGPFRAVLEVKEHSEQRNAKWKMLSTSRALQKDKWENNGDKKDGQQKNTEHGNLERRKRKTKREDGNEMSDGFDALFRKRDRCVFAQRTA